MNVDEDTGDCDGSRGDGKVRRVLRPVKRVCGRCHGGLSGLEIVKVMIQDGAVSVIRKDDMESFIWSVCGKMRLRRGSTSETEVGVNGTTTSSPVTCMLHTDSTGRCAGTNVQTRGLSSQRCKGELHKVYSWWNWVCSYPEGFEGQCGVHV